MKSSNPVFARSPEFNGRGGASARTNDPSQWQIDLSGQGTGTPTHMGTGSGRMTLESVVEKTALLLGIITIAAAATWFVIGDLGDAATPADPGAQSRLALFSVVGIVGVLGLSLINAFKKSVSPPLIVAYAVAEGLFIGAYSKMIAVYVVGEPSVVFQAVLATFVTFAVVLGAYKFFNIQINDRFRKMVALATVAAFGVMMVNLVLSLTGVLDQGGLRGFNTLGLVVSLILVGLAVFNLINDFDYVERGVEAGLPQRESWRAAFGLTVTLVWIYIEMIRIIAILRNN